jgi:hypothetical protein
MARDCWLELVTLTSCDRFLCSFYDLNLTLLYAGIEPSMLSPGLGCGPAETGEVSMKRTWKSSARF